MRFKEFVTEVINKPFVDTVDEAEFLDWVKRYSPKYVSGTLSISNYILRGIPSEAKFAIGNSHDFVRKAAYTSNFVNLFIQSSPRWSKFPSRASGYICTNDEELARKYSRGFDSYLVIPADNAVVGVCPQEDFWPSFEIGLKHAGIKTLDNVNHINQAIEDIGDYLGVKFSEDDPKELHRTLRKIKQSDLMKIRNNDLKFDLIHAMNRLEVTNLNDLLEIILGPELNKFSYSKATDVQGRSENLEMWVSGRCAFVLYEKNKLKEKIEWLKNAI